MLKGSAVIHESALSVLVTHLGRIGEDVHNIESIIKEPIWTPEQNILLPLVN